MNNLANENFNFVNNYLMILQIKFIDGSCVYWYSHQKTYCNAYGNWSSYTNTAVDLFYLLYFALLHSHESICRLTSHTILKTMIAENNQSDLSENSFELEHEEAGKAIAVQ